MGIENPEGTTGRRGRDWFSEQVCRHDTFSMVMYDAVHGADDLSYTKHEDYVKVNFWLSGKHLTILDGFGELEHGGPEVFITLVPARERFKVDVLKQGSHISAIALCLLRDFFSPSLRDGSRRST